MQRHEEEPFWMQFLHQSIFKFPLPELESEYETFLGSQVGCYSSGLCGGILFGFVCVILRICAGLHSESFRAPPGLFPSLLLSFIPAGFAAMLIHFRPKFYSRHWRSVNVLWKCFKLLALLHLQQLVLWMQVCNPEGCCEMPKSGPDNLRTFRMFMTENYYLTIIWSHAFAFVTGQAMDLVFASAGLGLCLASNEAICGSPIWGPALVSLSPPLVSFAELGSKAFFALLSAHGFPSGLSPPTQLSCRAVRGFWQIVGWWLFCILMLLREVGSRRAFLHTSASAMEPGPAASIKRWPFSNPLIVQRLACAIAAACLAPSLIWVATIKLLP